MKALWLCVALAALAPLSAQSPRFEAASIKLSKDPAPGGDTQITPGRFRGKDLALQWLILTAYRIRSGNLSGELPNWTISERYDIEAKTAEPLGEDQVLVALQNLLAERFGLRLHREMRDEPVYFLTAAKSGIKMAAGSCVPVKQDFPNECWSQGGQGLIHTLDWRGVRMSDPGGVAYRTLTGQLPGMVRRAVIDKTGLTGTFDVHLRWASDPPNGADVGEPGAPSIFDALPGQLGLRLEAGRGPVEYVVVDHVERPSGN
jgi:uncharacterized protein (TIGR03435 family)